MPHFSERWLQAKVELRKKLITKHVSQPWRFAGAIFYSLVGLLPLIGLLLIPSSVLPSKDGVLFLTVFTWIAQLIVIYYIYRAKNIIYLVREAIHALIMAANCWLYLFLIYASQW